MFKETRRKIMKKTAPADEAVTAAGAPGAKVTDAMAAVFRQKWNKEIDVVVVGAGLWGLAACITTGDPNKITLLF